MTTDEQNENANRVTVSMLYPAIEALDRLVDAYDINHLRWDECHKLMVDLQWQASDTPAQSREEMGMKAKLFVKLMRGKSIPETALQVAMSIAVAHDLIQLEGGKHVF